MNIPLCFFISLGVCAVGLIAAFANMIFGIKQMFERPTMVFIIHLIAGLMYALGGLSSIIFGIVWIVTYLKN